MLGKAYKQIKAKGEKKKTPPKRDSKRRKLNTGVNPGLKLDDNGSSQSECDESDSSSENILDQKIDELSESFKSFEVTRENEYTETKNRLVKFLRDQDQERRLRSQSVKLLQSPVSEAARKASRSSSEREAAKQSDRADLKPDQGEFVSHWKQEWTKLKSRGRAQVSNHC